MYLDGDLVINSTAPDNVGGAQRKQRGKLLSFKHLSSTAAEKNGKRSMHSVATQKHVNAGHHAFLLEFSNALGQQGITFKYDGPDSNDRTVIVPEVALQPRGT